MSSDERSSGVTRNRSNDPTRSSSSRYEPATEVPNRPIITMIPGTNHCHGDSPVAPAATSSGPYRTRKTSGWSIPNRSVNGSRDIGRSWRDRTMAESVDDGHQAASSVNAISGSGSAVGRAGREVAGVAQAAAGQLRKTSSSVGRRTSALVTTSPAPSSARRIVGIAAAPSVGAQTDDVALDLDLRRRRRRPRPGERPRRPGAGRRWPTVTRSPAIRVLSGLRRPVGDDPAVHR